MPQRPGSDLKTVPHSRVLNCAGPDFFRREICRVSRREHKSEGSLPDPATQPKAELASERITMAGIIDARRMCSINSTLENEKRYHNWRQFRMVDVN